MTTSPAGLVHWVDSDADAVASARRGDDRPVIVCLHGIGSSSASFAPQFRGLSPAHRVVAWDAPGYGASADPPAPPGMAGYGKAVVDMIDQFGERVHLLGVSWGGVIALQVALTAGHLLRGVVLVGASRGSGRSQEAAEAMRRRADDLERLGPDEFARARAPRLVSPDADPALVALVTQTMARSVRLPGYGYAADAMAGTDLSGRLSSIDVPVLVLYGEADTVTGRDEGDALAASIPEAVSVSVARAGHLANQEQPDAVNAWVASFVQIVHHLDSDQPVVARDR